MRKFIDISNLNFREKDEITEIFKAYDLRVPFDIEKYRDDRLRYHFKDRYDFRENMVDWDYVYKLKENVFKFVLFRLRLFIINIIQNSV